MESRVSKKRKMANETSPDVIILFEKLGSSALSEIFLGLTLQEVVRSRLVSKKWKNEVDQVLSKHIRTIKIPKHAKIDHLETIVAMMPSLTTLHMTHLRYILDANLDPTRIIATLKKLPNLERIALPFETILTDKTLPAMDAIRSTFPTTQRRLIIGAAVMNWLSSSEEATRFLKEAVNLTHVEILGDDLSFAELIKLSGGSLSFPSATKLFLNGVQFNNTNGLNLIHAPKLEDLEIYHCKEIDLENSQEFWKRSGKSLHILRLNECSFDGDLIFENDEYPNLQVLDVSRVAFNPSQISLLLQSPKLQYVTFGRNFRRSSPFFETLLKMIIAFPSVKHVTFVQDLTDADEELDFDDSDSEADDSYLTYLPSLFPNADKSKFDRIYYRAIPPYKIIEVGLGCYELSLQSRGCQVIPLLPLLNYGTGKRGRDSEEDDYE